MFSKNSLESISFELTQQNLQLTPKSITQSPSKLNYSDSNVSIDQMINEEPFLSLHIEHEGNNRSQNQEDLHHFRQRNSHFFEFNKGLRCCIDSYIGKIQANRFSLAKIQHSNIKDKKYCKSFSKPKRKKQLRSQSNDSQNSQQKNLCLRNQPIHCLKAQPFFKQNVEPSGFTKKYESKVKSSKINNISTQKEFKKQYKRSFKKNINEQFPKLTNTVAVKHLDLSQNEIQTKRNMKKIGLSRQVILRSNHKICVLPIL